MLLFHDSKIQESRVPQATVKPARAVGLTSEPAELSIIIIIRGGDFISSRLIYLVV
jgi:hypothetical protein